MTDLDLDAIKARADAATEGPWRSSGEQVSAERPERWSSADVDGVADHRFQRVGARYRIAALIDSGLASAATSDSSSTGGEL